MGFALQNYNLTVVDARTKEAITSGVYVFIYDAGTKTLSTIYSSDRRAALTNPITRTAFGTLQAVQFYSAATSHDIFVADDRGNVSFLPSITPNDHNIQLNREGVSKCFVTPFAFVAGGTVVDTGLDFPLNTLVTDVFIEVVDVDATETIDVGLLASETAGDEDGFLVAASVATAGFIRPWVITASTTEIFVATPYKGALLGKGSAGTSAANDFGQPGGFGHVITGSNARSLTYTPSSSDTMTGYIYANFRHLR